MTSQTSTTSSATAEIRMGHGLVAPGRAVPAQQSADPAPGAAARPAWRRKALAAAALLSPVGLAAQYALNSAGLPRQDAQVYLTAVAEAPGRILASTIAYAVGMATMVAVGAVLAIGLRRRSPGWSAAAAALLTLGAIGGGGFVGLRFAALALVEDGRILPGGVEAFVRLQDGLINQVGILLACAILGTVATVVALARSRADIGWWPAAVTLVGFVLASGEFPVAVSVLGALVQGTALLPVVRLAVAEG